MKNRALITSAVVLACVGLAFLVSPPVMAQVVPQPGDVPAEKESCSPYAGRQFPTEVFWGDPDILATEKGKRWYDMLMTGDYDKTFAAAMAIVSSLQKPDPPFETDKLGRDAWREYAREGLSRGGVGRHTKPTDSVSPCRTKWR